MLRKLWAKVRIFWWILQYPGQVEMELETDDGEKLLLSVIPHPHPLYCRITKFFWCSKPSVSMRNLNQQISNMRHFPTLQNLLDQRMKIQRDERNSKI